MKGAVMIKFYVRTYMAVLSLLFLTLTTYSSSLYGQTAKTNKAQKMQFITIGTGGITGVYYPTGGAISKILNKKKDANKMRASVESTAGSVFNVNAVVSGDLEFGIVQSDRQYQAVKGLAEWKRRGQQKAVRSVFSLHSEIVTLVAAEDSKIRQIKDLKGKRVNIGNFGSGQRQNAMDILKIAGLDWQKDFKAEALKAAEAPKMLQDNRIDAFFFTVGHPSGTITEATSGKRKVRFVPIVGMDKLLEQLSYYSAASIPKSTYPMAQNQEDVPSIGMKATLITSSSVSEDVVYKFTKAIFENLNELKQSHPALNGLVKKDMFSGLSAPLHKGAVKYYKEAKLDKHISKRLLD